MFSGVSILCFAASYTVALVLEISRLLFRSGVRGAVMLGFAGAGLVAHSAYLYYQAVHTVGSPLSSEHDWYLVAAWVLVVVYLYMVYYHPRNAFGLFLLPLVLGLIATAHFVADLEPFARGPASKTWGIIHGVSILLAVVAVAIGFATGLMYLGQVRRLKHKRPPIRGLRLPSLEWLERANGRAIVVSLLMLGPGVISGIILNAIGRRAQGSGVPWHDPVVLSTVLMFTWLLIAVVVGALYRPARAGRKVAYLTVVSFVFLVIALGVGLLVDTQHGGRNQGAGDRGQGAGDRVEGSGFRVQGLGSRGRGAGGRELLWPVGGQRQMDSRNAHGRCSVGRAATASNSRRHTPVAPRRTQSAGVPTVQLRLNRPRPPSPYPPSPTPYSLPPDPRPLAIAGGPA